jgi:lysine-N-methylase
MSRSPLSLPLPARPRLAAHVLPRLHLAAGEEVVILHDTRAGRLVQIGRREWELLAAADGTRDLEGIVLAAARSGSHAKPAALQGFLEQLSAAGMIDEGPYIEIDAPPARPVPADRPLDPLAGYSLRCDGSGSCCRLYASVLFSPVEVARARSLLPAVLDAGARRANAFFPERGSGPCAASAVALVDGRCAYLAESGLCSLHAAGGEGGKPRGCNLFPATFTDDGEAVRVSVAVECACVLASARIGSGGAPLVPEGALARGDLDEAVFIAVVPEQVRVSRDRSVSRGELVAWSRAALEALADPSGADLPAALWSMAADVEASGLDVSAARRAFTSPKGPSSDDLMPWLEALRRRAARRAHEDSAWRSDRDLARRATRWLERSAALLLDPGVGEAALRRDLGASPGSGGSAPASRDEQRASEALYVRALLHGHQLVDPVGEGPPLALALRDRAVRLLLGRAMPEAIALVAAEDPKVTPDPAERHPLALVEAMLRGHGLSSYRRDIEDY